VHQRPHLLWGEHLDLAAAAQRSLLHVGRSIA
jgi:hypothetical protein